MIIAAVVGVFAIGAGVFMGWFMKNLWYNYDPEGALADQEFDYFKWTDVTGEIAPGEEGFRGINDVICTVCSSDVTNPCYCSPTFF